MTKPTDITESNLEDFVNNKFYGEHAKTIKAIQRMLDTGSGNVFMQTDSTIYIVTPDKKDKDKIYIEQMDSKTKEKGKTAKIDKKKKEIAEESYSALLSHDKGA